MTTPSPSGAGLYIHVPFCSAICPYCDFAVEVGRPPKRAAFVAKLNQEIRLWGDWESEFDTLYFGGGTPSILTADELDTIVQSARAHLPVAGHARLFMEVNPEDVTAERAAGWRELGVSTISLGVQSFVDAELKQLGRRHDAAQARSAVETCLNAGFETVSADLIFGLPRQSVEQLQLSLDVVTELCPQHVSCYQLTIHEQTTFARWRDKGKLTELPDNKQWLLFERLHNVLAQAGWNAYEVSNFARAARHQSMHNMKYWRHVPYLGVGPSAHSFDGRSRWWNLRTVKDYQAALMAGRRPIDARERLTDDELALETVMLGMRTTQGIDLTTFRERFGLDLVGRNLALVRDLREQGLVHTSGGAIAPTLAGLAVADGLAARFELQPTEQPRS